MTAWRDLRDDALRLALLEHDPAVEVEPRTERLAATLVGLLVLVGAVGTYMTLSALVPALTNADPPVGPEPGVTAGPSPPTPSPTTVIVVTPPTMSGAAR